MSNGEKSGKKSHINRFEQSNKYQSNGYWLRRHHISIESMHKTLILHTDAEWVEERASACISQTFKIKIISQSLSFKWQSNTATCTNTHTTTPILIVLICNGTRDEKQATAEIESEQRANVELWLKHSLLQPEWKKIVINSCEYT